MKTIVESPLDDYAVGFNQSELVEFKLIGDITSCPMAYINDAKGSKFSNNCQLCETPLRLIDEHNTWQLIYVQATHTINGGDELLMPYGVSFWGGDDTKIPNIKRKCLCIN
jgi:hypothetical protein